MINIKHVFNIGLAYHNKCHIPYTFVGTKCHIPYTFEAM